MPITSPEHRLEESLTQKGAPINPSVPFLMEEALSKGEGILTSQGALAIQTGKYTGRSPKDKFIVREPSTEASIDWTSNLAFEKSSFETLYSKMLNYLTALPNLYVYKGFAGADSNSRIGIQIINERAWHNLFVRNLFVLPNQEELQAFHADFTILHAPGFKATPLIDGTNSEAFILISFEKRVILIGGTEYAGEVKKSVFTVMNYLLPEQGILSMHCSANVGKTGDVALFFGLSGTGKTTLSNDPERELIGDDEHGWSEQGIFNIEGGCYAKTIHLSKEKEPIIWNAISYGTVLENVIVDNPSRQPNFEDGSLTENTRAAYPLSHLSNIKLPSTSGHPNTIIFLTADAFGVLPPISKLTKEQAIYHFLSGYTSKLAGTERDVHEPVATFSTCFGAPFLPQTPFVYADLLKKKLDQVDVDVYLINTGWTGGAYGKGKRIPLNLTRSMVQAAVRGTLKEENWIEEPYFGLHIPVACPGVPSDVLNPKATWEDSEAYHNAALQLAKRFEENYNQITKKQQEC